MSLFDDRSPDVSGGSAGINSAEFWSCPACGAAVLDMHGERTGRTRHERWHDSFEDAPPADKPGDLL